ncbi:MAG: hypothetical protein LR015_06865 [Verrucomicrobia bacterium]|nr:hypothetical protein [Verrucomicrobiota bacterium]
MTVIKDVAADMAMKIEHATFLAFRHFSCLEACMDPVRPLSDYEKNLNQPWNKVVTTDVPVVLLKAETID